MKACFVGLGSIGKRHIKNLRKAYKGELRIDAVRSSNKELESTVLDLVSSQYYNLDAMPDDYDVVFITNPTYMHYNTMLKTLNKTKNMFIEKPIFEKCAGQLKNITYGNNVYYVACPLRHKVIMKYVKETICKSEEILSVRAISSSYLPDWRKHTDYRNCYSAHKDFGGGVAKDLIHEWDYLTELFGYPYRVERLRRHLSGLDIDSDDVAVYMAEYEDMFLELHLDYIGHKNQRSLELYCNDKTYFIDLLGNVVEEYRKGVLTGRKEFPTEDFYYNEMEFFLQCIAGEKENINTPERAYRVLSLALGDNCDE